MNRAINIEDLPALLKVSEFAEYTGRSKMSVNKAIMRGDLDGYIIKISGLWYIKRELLEGKPIEIIQKF